MFFLLLSSVKASASVALGIFMAALISGVLARKKTFVCFSLAMVEGTAEMGWFCLMSSSSFCSVLFSGSMVKAN